MCNFNYYDEFIADILFVAADAYEEENRAMEEAAEWEAYEEDMALMAVNEEELRTRIEKALMLVPEDSMIAKILRGEEQYEKIQNSTL